MPDAPTDPWSVQDPPHDLSAEIAVLGSMLLSPAAVDEATVTLTAQDFYRPVHATIFAAAVALYERGAPVDPVTVLAELTGMGELDRVGGGPYLHTLAASVPSPASIAYYASTVHDRAITRRLLAAGEGIRQIAQQPIDPADQLAAAHARLAAVDDDRASSAVRLGDLADPLFEALSGPRVLTGMMTGWLDLDLFLNPLERGQLIVIGARPGIGKSVAGLDLARECAIRQDEVSAIASLEMSRDEITLRAVAAEARVPLTRLQGHDLLEHDWEAIAKARARIVAAPLIIDDSGYQSLSTLRALIRRTRCRLLVVDFLQLVTPPKGRDRRESMDALSRGCKLMAKSEDCTVVILCQLNRKAEDRHDKRPQMADLRESGAIEQDADVVILLHREDAYTPTERAGEVDLIVTKQRNGPTGQATLTAQLQYARFTDYSKGGWA